MFPSNNQFSIQPRPLAVVDTTAPMQLDQNEASSVARDEKQNGGLLKANAIIQSSEKLQDDLRMIGLKIKQHEDNIKLIKTLKNKLEDSILDMQVMLGKYHSSSAPTIENVDNSQLQSEQETNEQIARHENSAAAIICQLKTRHGTQISHSTLTKDVLGAVATLGKVDDENLIRLLSEYLGVQTMLAIVCRTFEGVKALETYNEDGGIDKTSGLYALGGGAIDGRFQVICLENLRPYAGDFVADDPQRRLDLVKPRLRNGECPPGFLGFAVNMIHIDQSNLFCVTASGDGLRETLFYNLFSRLQVYRTRKEMVFALPCISEGAVSLDGGMIRSTGVFSLGTWEEVDVRFPKFSATSDVPSKYIETEQQLKKMKWEKEKLEEDMKREQALIANAKLNFESKKQDFVKFLAQSSSYAAQQHQFQAARNRLTPR